MSTSICQDQKEGRTLAERVKDCKKQGLVDAFIYNSTNESYLAAILDSL